MTRRRSPPALTKGNDPPSSGKYGVLDQIAGLQWGQRSIAQFGGDPARVTIFGESAGALNFCTLIASPLASGLFAGATMESGGSAAMSFDAILNAVPQQVNIAAAGGQEDAVHDQWVRASSDHRHRSQ